jgi:23S rRNA (uracil1939-C5)-methyltransferase
MGRRKKIPAEPLWLEIQSLSHEGRGVARTEEGRVVFVRNALPGERVLAKVERVKRQLWEATAIDVQAPSSLDRVPAPCAHAAVCGGCALQHLSPAQQVAHKHSVLVEQLEHFGGLTPAEGFLPPLIAETEGYRRKARLACKYVVARERVMVGFREAASHFIANIETCPVLHDRVGTLLPQLSEIMTTLSIRDKIPQIEVAVSDEEVAFVVRHLAPLSVSDLQTWVVFCQDHGISLYLQPGGLDTVHKVWPDDKNERLVTRLLALDLTYQFHPLDFLQVNKAINDQLIPLALSLLDVQPTDTVLDLFCGLGNFTLPLARKAARVVGVEGSQEMVNRGQENAKVNNLANIAFYHADLTQPMTEQPWFGQYDKLLIDPPRSGAADVVSQIHQLQPKRVVYVSCNPATLARDVNLLHAAGYSLKTAGILDMFPHTKHVESIAVLERPITNGEK